MPTSDLVLVEFNGHRAESDIASWGQRMQWDVINFLGPEAYDSNVSRTIRIPSYLSIPEVLGIARQLLERHEALRTTCRIDERGDLRQDVMAAGQVAVEIINGIDAEAEADSLEDRLVRDLCRPNTDFPVRFAILAERSTPRYLVMVVSHLACDEWAIDIVHQDTSAMFAEAAGSARSYPAVLHPLDRARYEASDAGKRLQARNLEYCRKTMMAMTPTLFPEPATAGEDPRFWTGQLNSSALTAAIDTLADRYKVSRAAVLLAATAVVLGARHHDKECTIQVVSSNRFIAGIRASVGTFWQYGLASIDLNMPSFSAVVNNAWHSGLVACRHAQYDPVSFIHMKNEVEALRRSSLDLSASLNFHTPADLVGLPIVPRLAVSEIRALAKKTNFNWHAKMNYNQVKYYLHAAYAPDNTQLSVDVDTRYLSPEEIETCLRATENILLAALDQDVMPSALSDL